MAFPGRGSDSIEQIIVGGGDMGVRMRAVEWAATALGPVERWPQSLRSAISILLPSKAQIILFWGPDLIALYNDAYRPVFGAKHPWALGRPARECWSEVWDVLRPLFEGVMRTGEAFWAKDHPFYIERHGYSEETYFDVSYDPVRDESGGVGGVFCIVSETTGRVLGERRLRMLRELGVETSAKSDADVFGQAAAALAGNPADVPFALLYVLDEDARTLRLAEMVGLGRDGLVVPDAIDLRSSAPAAAVLQETIGSGTGAEASPALFVTALPSTASPERLLVLPLLSGTQPAGVLVAGVSRHLQLTGPYRDFFDLVAGRISEAVGSVRAYEEERRRAEALAELDRAKTVFFSNVSHEFRTPLTLLLGPLEDLLRAPALSVAPDVRDRVEVAHRNALRLLKLVNSLLDFSRIEAGRLQATYVATDLGRFTAELASAFRSLVERAGLRFVVDCPAGIAEAFIDREMWEKVVFNLLSNAFKYTLEGEIRVVVRQTDARVQLLVSDTGAGVAASDLPHIFERFHRVDNVRARTHEGTGIGLALVAELVKLHAGVIDVSSELGRGTTFTVSLPKGSAHLPAEHVGARAEPTAPARDATPYVSEARHWMPDDVAAALDSQALPPAGGDALPSSRILLADDNADMREYLRRLLGTYWSVEAVGDGLAALAAARARPPDLVVADVMMPGLSGFELLRALRADLRTGAVPVLLLSARAGEESRVEGLDAGADDYLVKPFSARELVARVNAHLKLAAARRQFAVELEHQRAKLETVLRQMPAGVVIVDAATGQPVLTNARAEQILPGGRAVHADGSLYARQEWPVMRSLRSGEVVTDEEIRVVRDDGAAVTLSVSSAPVCDGDGRVMAAVVVFQDATERLALLAREQAARAEADAANRAKDRFLAVLSHELRTPLNAIMGWSRILRSIKVGESERVHAATVIGRNAERQAQLVNDLLDVSRIAAGKLELDRFPVDLVPLIRDAIDSVRADVEGKRLHLTIDLDPSTGEVFGDLLRLQQVVLNLLTNAIKFTPDGGRIGVQLARHGEMARLTVTDTGEGIDVSVLPHIFEPFQQGDGSATTRMHQGLGLGLTIVRQLVSLHGGAVRAASPGRGHGSTFTIELPIVAVRVQGAAPPQSGVATGRVRSGEARLDGLRVLVVDDQPDARELVALVLRERGAEPRVAGSVTEALDVLYELEFDVLVSDLAMPGADGYGLIAAARAHESRRGGRKMRAIALTAHAGSEVRDRAVAAGFDAHATKPLDPEDLVELIARLPRL
jgi:signal transduction histidine kinase/response regulator RpfG family c-di-GMP phosphodiesterase